mmetsp:Transcript_9781/g.8795  ORF Transcript_9781/g.8795 Transcript_9781/m.8795 type:complete len:119 (-) Transcript_9781:150-506(-)|eukprot:CAMPEP_0201594868 /NCGR_PEP_ID=MMETSP0190_2-20130828/192054_1 /ASSEMBLY_ACC=CAM_ASM_000263 /TAXON_ID=37353 /ORGANISM="Rosalina sp." /LENGTH=118 /DNA_ID=CAMNT_0048054647 /DNA_START=91 /DNA_END=447 /DNA_ORIENTATION=-
MANVEQVEKEIEHLITFIKKLGKKNDKGQYVVKFGTLFDDDEAQQIFEAIVGTLKAAKKRKIIKFKGQILLKGAHDDVPITLLQQNEDKEEDNNGGDNNNNDNDNDKNQNDDQKQGGD